MDVARYWLRVELRQRWRSWLAIAVLVGIGGGLAASSLAAARRTDTAYPRFLEEADPPQLVLDFDLEADSVDLLDSVAALPGVLDRTDAVALALGRIVNGSIALSDLGTATASADGRRYFERDRVHVVEGRMPEPDRVGEVLVSQTVADEGVGVGDRLVYAVLDAQETFESIGSGSSQHVASSAERHVEVEVVGVGIFPELAVVDQRYAREVVLFTPALYETLPPSAELWSRMGLHLAQGTDVGALQREIKAMAAEAGGDMLFEDRRDITRRVQRSVRPYVLALIGLGIAAAVFVSLLGSQLVRRTLSQSTHDRAVLRALSADRPSLRHCATLPVVLASAVACMVALLIQAVVSTRTPVGPVAEIEPAPGVSVDAAVALPAIALIVAIMVAGIAEGRGRERSGAVPASLAGRMTQWGLPVTATLGVSRATGFGDRARRSAARASLASVAIATAMLVAVASFAASLGHLTSNPEVHGWNVDVALVGAGGYGSFDLETAADVEGVAQLSGAVFGDVSIGETSVPGMGVLPLRGSLLPPIIEGRAPGGEGEIALGRRSLEEVGATIGDSVEVRLPGDDPVQMEVVGVTVLPGIGPIDTDRPSLGEGALIVLPPEFLGEMWWPAVMADFAEGADHDQVTNALVVAGDEQAGDTMVFDLFRPIDIDSFARVGSVPLMLVGLFAAVAIGSLVHVLLVTNQTWRRDRAVLAALGAAPSQLRAAGRWQAVTIVVSAMLVGVPVGSTLGRWSWRSLAEQIGIDPTPQAALSSVAALLMTLLAISILVAASTERRAARQRPVLHLRAE